MTDRPGAELALLCLFGSSCKEKTACKHADALAACLVVVVAHACGWLVFRLAGDAESEPCGHASQAWVTTSDVSVRHLRLASVAGMGVQ